MPRVPTLPVGGSVQQSPLAGRPSGVNAPALAFGSGGEGLVEAGRDLMRFSGRVDEIQERDDKVAAKDTFLKYTDEARGVMRELRQRQRRDAEGVYDDGKGKLTELQAKYRGLLKNPRQQEMFGSLADSRNDTYLNELDSHQQHQLTLADKELSASMVTEAIQRGIEDFNNPATLKNSENEIRIAVGTMHKGADQKVIDSEVEQAVSKMYGEIVAMKLVDSPGEARAAFRQYRDKIDPDVRLKLDEHIKAKEKAYAADDKAKAFYEQLVAGKKSEADIDAAILKIGDIEQRRAVMSAFNMYSALFKEQQRELTNDAILESMAALSQKTLPDAYKYWKSLPEETEVQRKVKKTVGKQYEAAATAGGFGKETDPEAWTAGLEAIETAEVKDPKSLRVFLAERGPVMEKDAKRLDSLLEKVQKPGSVKDLTDAFKFALGKDGMPDTKLSKAEKNLMLKFTDWAEGQIKDTNRGQDPEFIKGLAKAFMLKGELTKDVNPWRKALGDYGDNKAFHEAVQDPDWMPDIPKTEQSRIDSIFENNPQVAKAWADKYGDLAKRAYFKAEIMKGIGPKRKEQ